MKILRLAVPSGYRMLKKGFSISFLAKGRVEKNIDNDDLFELCPGIYLPIESVFIGKNSSGKTTVLRLLDSVIRFLYTGRMESDCFDGQETLRVDVIFFESGCLFRYQGTFARPRPFGDGYALITDEYLQKASPKPSLRKDLRNLFFPKANLLSDLVSPDTSRVRDYVKADATILANSILESEASVAATIQTVNELYGGSAFDKVVHLFDDSVSHIAPAKEETGLDGFSFQRIGQAAVLVDAGYLRRVLSAGTYRGIFVFCAALIVFRQGGTLLLDEIEKSFNMNFVQNLILLFNDRAINKAGGTLIYTTHYAEILDGNGRLDNINVLHRSGCEITLSNLSEDYQIEPRHSKSAYFNQNAFDNLLNYESLMELREILI